MYSTLTQCFVMAGVKYNTTSMFSVMELKLEFFCAIYCCRKQATFIRNQFQTIKMTRKRLKARILAKAKAVYFKNMPNTYI